MDASPHLDCCWPCFPLAAATTNNSSMEGVDGERLYLCIYVYSCVWRGQRLTLGVFLYSFQLYVLSCWPLSRNLRLVMWTRLTCQQVPGGHHSYTHTYQLWGEGHIPLHPVCVGARDPNSSSHDCTVSALISEPSPKPKRSSYEETVWPSKSIIRNLREKSFPLNCAIGRPHVLLLGNMGLILFPLLSWDHEDC